MTEEMEMTLAAVGWMYEQGMSLHQAVKKVKELAGGRHGGVTRLPLIC